MTLIDRRRAALDALHWSVRQLGLILGYSETATRRWFRDAEAPIPPEVDAWLERRAEAIRADPPPVRACKRLPSVERPDA